MSSSLVISRSGAALLNHVLDDPELVAAVQSLPPSALGRLIDEVGLEDAGELVSLASTAQLVELLDEDLWHDGALDARRFLLWLEALLESGDAFAAARLAELDEDLLTSVVHQLVHVIDLERADTGDAGLDRFIERGLGDELGRFQLVARQPDGWDTLFGVLLALDRDHGELLERVLGRCAHRFDRDELFEVDADANREDRRAVLGYVSESDAAAFLAAAKRDGPGRGRDHVTKQYLAQAAPLPSVEPSAAAQRLMRLVAEPSPRRAALPARSGTPRFVTAMRALRDRPRLHAERMRELAHLANVLVAGTRRDGRRLRPIEALEEAVKVCSEGLELDGRSLEELPADHFFKVGWRAR